MANWSPIELALTSLSDQWQEHGGVLALDPLTLHVVPDSEGRAAYMMIDDNETIVVAGQLLDGTFDLQVQSGLRGLALNIYAVEEIKRVVCNGQEVKPKRIGAHSYAAELRLQGALEFS